MSQPCDDILATIVELTAQFDTLNASITSSTATANNQYGQILLQDNFGGTYPTIPLTSGAIQARINFLQAQLPYPQTLISMYMMLLALVISIEAMQAALAQTVTMLGAWKQKAIDNGCAQ